MLYSIVGGTYTLLVRCAEKTLCCLLTEHALLTGWEWGRWGDLTVPVKWDSARSSSEECRWEGAFGHFEEPVSFLPSLCSPPLSPPVRDSGCRKLSRKGGGGGLLALVAQRGSDAWHQPSRVCSRQRGGCPCPVRAEWWGLQPCPEPPALRTLYSLPPPLHQCLGASTILSVPPCAPMGPGSSCALCTPCPVPSSHLSCYY